MYDLLFLIINDLHFNSPPPQPPKTYVKRDNPYHKQEGSKSSLHFKGNFQNNAWIVYVTVVKCTLLCTYLIQCICKWPLTLVTAHPGTWSSRVVSPVPSAYQYVPICFVLVLCDVPWSIFVHHKVRLIALCICTV